MSEAGGKRYSRFLGQCGVIAQGYWVCGHPLEHHGNAARLRHPHPFPQIAFFIDCSRFFITHPPPRTNIRALSLPYADTSRVTISQSKGSDNPTNASGRGILGLWGRRLPPVILSSGIFVILFPPFFHVVSSFFFSLLKFSVYFLCIFNTQPCIRLLSLCYGSACPPLTLLQLRYILWCFIVYFRIISWDLPCAFQSGV